MQITSLFPQNRETLLVNQKMKMNILELMHFFIVKIIESTQAFYFKTQFHRFDAHLGDTLCQIRACMLLNLHNESKKLTTFEKLSQLNQIKRMEEKITNKILYFKNLIEHRDSHYNKELDGKISLIQFLQKNSLDLIIPDYLIFLTQALILTEFSIVDINGISRGIDYEKICTTVPISKTVTKKIIHSFQQELTKKSCKFIFETLTSLKNFQEQKWILPHLKMTDNDNREVLPCFEITKILLAFIQFKKIPILLQIKDINKAVTKKYIFTINDSIEEYDICNNENLLDSETLCFIINATSSNANHFITTIRNYGLQHAILLNMAQHPQYSCSKLEFLSKNPYLQLYNKCLLNNEITAIKILENEFLTMQDLAKSNEFSNEDSSPFFIKHIFCDSLRNQSIKFLNNTIRKSDPLLGNQVIWKEYNKLNDLCEGASLVC